MLYSCVYSSSCKETPLLCSCLDYCLHSNSRDDDDSSERSDVFKMMILLFYDGRIFLWVGRAFGVLGVRSVLSVVRVHGLVYMNGITNIEDVTSLDELTRVSPIPCSL